jgi:hypothetical protein
MLSYHWKSPNFFSKISTFLCTDVFQTFLLHLNFQKVTYDMYVFFLCTLCNTEKTLKTSKKDSQNLKKDSQNLKKDSQNIKILLIY